MVDRVVHDWEETKGRKKGPVCCRDNSVGTRRESSVISACSRERSGGIWRFAGTFRQTQRERGSPVVREPRCGDEHGVVAPSSSLPSLPLFSSICLLSIRFVYPSFDARLFPFLASFALPSPRIREPARDSNQPGRTATTGCNDASIDVVTWWCWWWWCGGDGDTASGEKQDEAGQVEGERLLSGRGEWKPLMRPCVIRELSRPNEALTYLSYQPPLAPPSSLLHTSTPTNTEATEYRGQDDVTVLLSHRTNEREPVNDRLANRAPLIDSSSCGSILATFYPTIVLDAETRTV